MMHNFRTTLRPAAILQGLIPVIFFIYPVFASPEGGNTAKLDAEHTQYLKKTIEGSFSGIGAHISPAPDGIVIKGIIPGGGAEKAGLKIGEIIVAIDGDSAKGLSIPRAVRKLTGPVGSKVTLEIKDQTGFIRQVEIVRSLVVVSGVESRDIGRGIWLIKLAVVNKNTPNDLRNKLNALKEQNASGIVLDLRGSVGGHYQSVVEISSMFLPKGRTMWFYKPIDGEMDKVTSKIEQVTELPMVVLIDGKADSGELIAAAMKCTHRARLIGQKTSGLAAKRYIQDKPDGSSEKIVIGAFYSTNNDRITDVGIEPDIVIDPNSAEERIIEKAVETLGI